MTRDFFETMIQTIESAPDAEDGMLPPKDSPVLAALPTQNPPDPVREPSQKTAPTPRETPETKPQQPTADTSVVPAAPNRVSASDPWEALRQEALQCKNCFLAQARHNVVFGEGDPNADLMFIGEGPGAEEDRTGRPFVGEAGQLLDKMILAMQFRREEVYIGNIVKCRPPGNRTPLPEEAGKCIGFLRRQLALIRPKVIVLLGKTAYQFLMDKNNPITRVRGHWDSFEGIPVMPTYHPAYLLRNPAAKKEVWSDLQQVMKCFGKVPPPRPRR
ncbi:MAG: uracil-DNA glycosylase family protein [Victivallaceae bacterium]|nr:uracil-DNA glycosylase family protein [Victivallaceae bacterium]